MPSAFFLPSLSSFFFPLFVVLVRFWGDLRVRWNSFLENPFSFLQVVSPRFCFVPRWIRFGGILRFCCARDPIAFVPFPFLLFPPSEGGLLSSSWWSFLTVPREATSGKHHDGPSSTLADSRGRYLIPFLSWSLATFHWREGVPLVSGRSSDPTLPPPLRNHLPWERLTLCRTRLDALVW